eukprot:TRINITY_DN2989_c0_g1_i8.p3 TRINITY_DN2989_c0_g1~~TRINITY_DN2989_c0_g1_i8.p3  ORF type:complete len:123 (+),score=2.53 TRINITY_DN2989_c0_g1_i8:234-602(+)
MLLRQDRAAPPHPSPSSPASPPSGLAGMVLGFCGCSLRLCRLFFLCCFVCCFFGVFFRFVIQRRFLFFFGKLSFFVFVLALSTQYAPPRRQFRRPEIERRKKTQKKKKTMTNTKKTKENTEQ